MENIEASRWEQGNGVEGHRSNSLLGSYFLLHDRAAVTEEGSPGNAGSCYEMPGRSTLISCPVITKSSKSTFS
jgi:hypothetical protein